MGNRPRGLPFVLTEVLGRVNRAALQFLPDEEVKRMLFEGIEMVARQSGGVVAEDPGEVDIWRRIRVTPGVELHLCGDQPKLKPGDVVELGIEGLGQSKQTAVACS